MYIGLWHLFNNDDIKEKVVVITYIYCIIMTIPLGYFAICDRAYLLVLLASYIIYYDNIVNLVKNVNPKYGSVRPRHP